MDVATETLCIILFLTGATSQAHGTRGGGGGGRDGCVLQPASRSSNTTFCCGAALAPNAPSLSPARPRSQALGPCRPGPLQSAPPATPPLSTSHGVPEPPFGRTPSGGWARQARGSSVDLEGGVDVPHEDQAAEEAHGAGHHEQPVGQHGHVADVQRDGGHAGHVQGGGEVLQAVQEEVQAGRAGVEERPPPPAVVLVAQLEVHLRETIVCLGWGEDWAGAVGWGFGVGAGMHWKPPPPPSTVPSLCPAAVSLTARAGFSGICNRQ